MREKTFEIDPYEQEEVALKVVRYQRDTDGEILIFDPNQAEVHRFSGKGEYLGNLVRSGQGPGEFTRAQGLKAYFLNGQIWATSLFKIARFDKQGNLLEDKKLPLGAFHVIDVLVDESHYIALNSERTDEGRKRSVVLVDFYGTIQEWMISDPVQNRSFGATGATPEILYAFNKSTKWVAVGLNMEYKITVKDCVYYAPK